MENTRYSLVVFSSHPIQHFAPLFRSLATLVDLHVYYFSDFAQREQQVDPGFGVPVRWDVDLLDGYQHTYLSPNRISKLFGQQRHPLCSGIWSALSQKRWDGVLVFGYSGLNEWYVWSASQFLNIPVLYISDSELLRHRQFTRKLIKEIPVRIFFRGIAAYLAVGNHNANYARRYGMPQSRIFPGVYPVDIGRFRNTVVRPDVTTIQEQLRLRFSIPKESRVLLLSGKLVDYKRPQDLVEAAMLLSKTSSYPITCLFVGTGPLADKLQAACPEIVRVTGFVNQSEIPLFYCLADILVVCSSTDAHPLTVTEAACLGVPSVVSDRVGCAGNNDILRPGESGLVYRCGDTDELAKALRLLLEDDDYRARLGTRARELADTQTPDVAAQFILHALTRVQARRN